MLIVSNTSPISNLAAIGEISLLQKIYPKILIPSLVYTELMHCQEIQHMVSALVNVGWLNIQDPDDLKRIQTLRQVLDSGEAAAIALALECNADRLLIDERLGRSVAAQYGLKVRGILGILVNAKKQKLIPSTKQLLDRLIHDAGFRVSQRLYERTLQESDEQ